MDQFRSYWDVDSVTYDDSRDHQPRSALGLENRCIVPQRT